MSSLTVPLSQSHGPSSLSEGQTWECPQCTTINKSHHLNCVSCYASSNPFHGDKTDLARQLAEEQERRYSEAQRQSIKRPFGGKLRSIITGWTCPICSTVVSRIDLLSFNHCPACEHPFDPPKSSNEANNSSSNSSEFSIKKMFGLGSFFTKPKEVKQSPPTTLDNPGTSVDADRHRKSKQDSERMVLVSKVGNEFLDITISPVAVDPEERGSLVPTPSPSIDSGTCTMSDTSSQIVPPPDHSQPDSGIQQQYNPPVRCTEPVGDQIWRCKVCSTINRALPGQQKCYVCNIGNAPDNIALIVNGERSFSLPSPQVVETINNQTRSHYSFPNDRVASSRYGGVYPSPHPIHTDGVSERGATRPTQLITDANNVTRTLKPRTRTLSRSQEDIATPTPQKQCTQLIEVTRQEDVHKANQIYEGIRRFCLEVGPVVASVMCDLSYFASVVSLPYWVLLEVFLHSITL